MPHPEPELPPGALKRHLMACPECHSIRPSHISRCRLCGAASAPRIQFSIQKTLSWLITAILLYIPANLLPVMRTQTLGGISNNTIISGVIELWNHGSFLIASVIFLASIVVPIGKILVLAYLCLCLWDKRIPSPVSKTRAFEITDLLGKWSMIDVFVVFILVSLVQLAPFASIGSRSGILAFAGVVFCTMMAARSFDIRLLWDQNSADQNNTTHPATFASND